MLYALIGLAKARMTLICPWVAATGTAVKNGDISPIDTIDAICLP